MERVCKGDVWNACSFYNKHTGIQTWSDVSSVFIKIAMVTYTELY